MLSSQCVANVAMFFPWLGNRDRPWLLGLALLLTSPTDGEDSKKIESQKPRQSQPSGYSAPDDLPLVSERTPDRTTPERHRTRSIEEILRSAGTSESPSRSIDQAKRLIALSSDRFQSVKDYSCVLYKRERIKGVLQPYHVIRMKVREKPFSLYLKFEKPTPGREAIYIKGENDDHVLAHEVGLIKVLAGTLRLDPHGSTAMEGCRHPITEAGIGALIATVTDRWNKELHPDHSIITIWEQSRVGERSCLMIESKHPHRQSNFLFYNVKLYIDRDLGLPIRFEAYDWPTPKYPEGQLLEEYTYSEIRLNVGISPEEFDANNPKYSFGRF